MNTNNQQMPTMGEFMAKSRIAAIKSVAVAVAAAFLLAGVVYTGIHNFNLYRHALPPGQEIFGLIPVVLIEGGIVLFIVASFVWFSGGTQKVVASVSGWLLFAIAAFNTLVDSTLNVGTASAAMPDWLRMYAQYGVFVIPVLIMAILKLLFDLDPAKRTLDMQKALEHALHEAKFAAAQKAMFGEANRSALNDYAKSFGDMMADHIRQSAPKVIEGEAREVPPKEELKPQEQPKEDEVKRYTVDELLAKVPESLRDQAKKLFDETPKE